MPIPCEADGHVPAAIELHQVARRGSVILERGAGAGVAFSTDSVTNSNRVMQPQTTYGSTTQYFQLTLSPSVSARYVRLTNTSGNSSRSSDTFCQLAVGP